jgi:hypothetical protein
MLFTQQISHLKGADKGEGALKSRLQKENPLHLYISKTLK